jgi:hypothetical protein
MSDLTLETFSLLLSGERKKRKKEKEKKKCFHQHSNLSSLILWHNTRSE